MAAADAGNTPKALTLQFWEIVGDLCIIVMKML
jgi:hypothetical protein